MLIDVLSMVGCLLSLLFFAASEDFAEYQMQLPGLMPKVTSFLNEIRFGSCYHAEKKLRFSRFLFANRNLNLKFFF